MIRSFRDRRTARPFNGERVRGFEGFGRQAVRPLQVRDDATSLNDLRGLPSDRLEALKGDRPGRYSIRINEQWRRCFEWRDQDAFEVEIVDYH